jgi:hypothetical protein
MINFLNVSNYVLTYEDETYYMTNGVRSLFDLCKGKELNFRAICLDLYAHKTINIKGLEISII